MATAKEVIDSIKPHAHNALPPTPRGQIGYDNPREDIEKIKKLREATIESLNAPTITATTIYCSKIVGV